MVDLSIAFCMFTRPGNSRFCQSSMGVARDCHGIMADDHIHEAVTIIFSTGRGQNLLTFQENQTIFGDFFGDFLLAFCGKCHGDLLERLVRFTGDYR